ncbi:HAD family phosphatase [uncultured Jannaschia sp.]|uniref:HAD family hydrolase n=1 Tax=uncultured Jannaschia sp. TaxID=293347 RepID=UPI00262B8B0A|nr:HAD family phosphatase [uncultured Jannaschia sp.]
MTIRAVVFDIGNVLIEWQPERWYDARIGADRRRAMFAALDLHAMNDRVDRGEGFRDVIYGTAAAHPDWADEIRMWHDHWLDLATPEIPRSVRLMRALRAKDVPVHALTNFGVETFALARTRYDFLSEFDRTFVSGHLRVIKPDAGIYAAVEDGTGLGGDALLFADDRAENIAAAAARGWRTHHFEGPDGWADRLVSEGLLSEQEAA